jgi:hypothetical protein
MAENNEPAGAAVTFSTADRLHRLHKAVEDCGFSSLADALIHELDAVDDEGPTGQRARAFYRSDCVRLLNIVVNDKGIASNMSEGNTFVSFAANFISDVLEQEIDAISTNTTFAPHNMDKQQAPILHALFHRLVKTESHNADLDIEGDTDMVSGLDEESEQKSQRPLDRSLIATTALGMLCYARNRSSNALQGIMGHFLFAMNTARSCMEVLHRLGLSVPYETVTATLKANSVAAQEQLRLQVSRRRFLISFNNYHKRQNARDIGHERGHEVTHSAGYVCLMKCCDKDKCECGSLPLNSIDHSGAKRVSQADFIPTKETAEYLTLTRNSLFGQALMRHCGKAMRKQRNDHGNIMHQVEDPPLQHIRAASGKAQIFTLKTFDQDQATVDAAIRNIDNICTELGIGETEIADKVVMFHGDDLTVRDITIAKYLRVRDIGPFEQFTWIEPIAGLFHLQMNVLKMLMHIFEGGIMDPASLQRFRFLFGREGVDKEVKDFHACDEFFRNVSDAHILALFMHQHGIRTFDDLDVMLGESDWPAAIRNVVKDGVGDIFRVTGIRKTALDSIRDEVDTRMKKLQQEREELLRKRRQTERETGKKYQSLQPPQWNKLRRKIERDLTGPKRDIVNENALLFLQCALVYQDFHEACRDGFSGRVEKCIELFALMFQGTKFRHYAADCLHLVACLKHIWKPEFKQAWLSYCLIDPDGRGEYCGLDRYGETLIRENKDKV